jgi:hypothetical protein
MKSAYDRNRRRSNELQRDIAEAGFSEQNGHAPRRWSKEMDENVESRLSFRETADFEESEIRKESEIRTEIPSNMMTAFLWINGAVFLFIFVVFITDCVFVIAGLMPSSDRIVDAKVIVAMMGAATVQLGAIAFGWRQWRVPAAARGG